MNSHILQPHAAQSLRNLTKGSCGFMEVSHRAHQRMIHWLKGIRECSSILATVTKARQPLAARTTPWEMSYSPGSPPSSSLPGQLHGGVGLSAAILTTRAQGPGHVPAPALGPQSQKCPPKSAAEFHRGLLCQALTCQGYGKTPVRTEKWLGWLSFMCFLPSERKKETCEEKLSEAEADPRFYPGKKCSG